MATCGLSYTSMHTIGILGGTFNPIHFGHLRLAEEILENLSLDEVRLIPSAQPPHKAAPQVSAEHRANMVKLAIQDNPKFVLDDCELKRDGASYTVDTLIELRQKLGAHVSFFLIMGSDAFAHLNTWHRWQEILDYCHIVLVQRPQHENFIDHLSADMKSFFEAHHQKISPNLPKNPAGSILTQIITPLAISSTNIREQLKNKKSVRYLLPQNVSDYIETHQLYT